MDFRARLVMTLTLVAAAVALATSLANGVLAIRARVADVRDMARLSTREVYGQVDRAIREHWKGDLGSTLRHDAALRAQVDALVGNSPSTLYVAVTDADGKAVLHSDQRLQGQPLPAAIPLESFANRDAVTQLLALARGEVTFASDLLFTAGGKPLGGVRVGVSSLLLRRDVFGAAIRQAATASVIVVVAYIAAVLIAGRLLAPFHRLRLELARLDPGDGRPRFDLRTSGDVERITKFFSTLGESLTSGRGRSKAGDQKAEAMGRLAAAAAHQMRTPLNTMVMHLAMLRDSADATSRGRIDILEGEIRRLDNVVQGFLRLARAGEEPPAPIPPAAVLQEALDRVGPRARATGVQLESAIGEALPLVQGNAELLGEAILNVLTNAFDATPAGGRVGLTARRNGNGGLEVVVEDSGRGIPAEELSRVFDPYFTTKEHGTGIGLPLVKKIAELHGGDVSVESGGAGTRVTLLLPATEGS